MTRIEILMLVAGVVFGLNPVASIGECVAEETLTPISLDDVPAPPVEVEELIEAGGVSFRYGPRSLLERDEPDRVSNGRRTLAAETRFHLKYDYSSRTRWRIRQLEHERQLVIHVWYDTLDMVFSHDVWFGQRPSNRGFWDERLVRHELDHVRISSNALIKKRFAELVRGDDTIVETVDDATEVTQAMVRKVVDRQVRDAFDQIVDLVRIRYEELDRVTNHGLRPIPESSETLKWVQNGSSAPQESGTAEDGR